MYEDKESLSHDEEVNIHTYFAKIPKPQDDDMGYTEYLHVAFDLSFINKNNFLIQSLISLIIYWNQTHCIKS